jgi:hypothetical protein
VSRGLGGGTFIGCGIYAERARNACRESTSHGRRPPPPALKITDAPRLGKSML